MANTIVIVGAGAAGIFTAYQINKQFPGQFDVQLFEAAPAIGGNVSSLSVQYGGQTYTIDAGAQFFSASAQPNYMQLIHELGLDSQITLNATGLTVWESSTNQRLFWIPSSLGDLGKYGPTDWSNMFQFIGFVIAAGILNLPSQPDLTLSVDDWFANAHMPAGDDFKKNVIKNFLYQFVSLPYNRIGEASAVYATTYFVRNLAGAPKVSKFGLDIPTFQTNQCLIGLLGILEAALKASGASAKISSPVTSVAPGPNGVAVTVGGSTINAKYVVLACDPGTSATLLANGGTADANLISILKQLGNLYLNLSIVMQKDGSCWMPGDTNYWEGVTTLVNTPQQSVAFNAWFGPLRPTYGGNNMIPVFKSWGAPDLKSSACGHEFFSHVHSVLLPTTTFMKVRSQLDAYQNRSGLSFAGGWTTWFDSQEAALLSAMKVAQMVQPAQAQLLRQSADAYDPTAIPAQVKSWVEMIQQQAPQPYAGQLSEAVKQLS